LYETEFCRRLSPVSLQSDHLPTYENSLCGDPRGYVCGKSSPLLPEPVQPVGLLVYGRMDRSIDFLSFMFRRAQPGVSVGSIGLEVRWSVRRCTPKCCALEPVPLLQVLPLRMYSSCLFFFFFSLSVRFAALTGMRLENWWFSFGALLVWCATGLLSLCPRQTPVWMCVPPPVPDLAGGVQRLGVPGICCMRGCDHPRFCFVVSVCCSGPCNL
jgi:hypothetical protein